VLRATHGRREGGENRIQKFSERVSIRVDEFERRQTRWEMGPIWERLVQRCGLKFVTLLDYGKKSKSWQGEVEKARRG